MVQPTCAEPDVSPYDATVRRIEAGRHPTRIADEAVAQKPHRQSSVQPIRRSARLESERRRPIKLEEGSEREYLENLKQIIEEERTSELASSMPFISHDLLTLMEDSRPFVQSTTLQLLHNLFPLYALHFRSVLSSSVENAVNLATAWNRRTSAIASMVLADMPKSFDGSSLLRICLSQQPSLSLLNFMESVISLGGVESDLKDGSIASKVLILAHQCSDTVASKDRHGAARIIQKVYEENPESLRGLSESLDAGQLEGFEQFLASYLPSVQLRSPLPDVPQFNPGSPVTWRRKIRRIVDEATTAKDWNKLRPMVFQQINQSLIERPDSTVLELLQTIFRMKGLDDFAIVLPGLLGTARTSIAKQTDAVLLYIMQNAGMFDLFAALQPHVPSGDPDLSRAAIALQTKLISPLEATELLQLVPSIITSLSQAFESELPEIRKAVVLCFVELYAKLGKGLMDRHTTHLSKGQQRLIAIYLSRRKQ
jgi:hypothetical protein